MDKEELRRRFLAWREGLSPEERQAAGRAIGERVESLPIWSEAQSVLLYYSCRGEVDTLGLAASGWRAGKTVLLPRVKPGRRLEPVVWEESAGLRRGPFGIPAPEGAPYTGPVDLVLVPGVAFDEQGGRLGYGGGYYDRLLEDKGKEMRTLGLAYEGQLATRLPREEHDVGLDAVVTEERIIWAQRA